MELFLPVKRGRDNLLASNPFRDNLRGSFENVKFELFGNFYKIYCFFAESVI